jgi:hypothetical protein
LSIRSPRSVLVRQRCPGATLAAGAAALTLLAGLIGARPAHADLAAVGAVDPATEVPAWFQDKNGLKLGLCLDGPPFCLTTADEFNAPGGEAFYFNAQADLAIGAAGKAKLVLAQEATNPAGGRAAFMRVRVTITSARPSTVYSITHPFGSLQITTDSRGDGKDTVDAGCTAGPCPSFAGALTGQIGPFLQWDPRVGPPPPANHIGDGVTPHRVVGGTNGDSFTITGLGGGGTTNLFTVAGILAGPPVPVFRAPATGDFGSTPPGVPVTRTITVTNFGVPDDAGRSNLAIGAIGLSGPQAAEFAIVGNTCSGQSMKSGASCAVAVQFAPGAPGARTASLDFAHNAVAGASHIALGGTATAPALTSAAVAGTSAASRLRISKLRTTHRMSRARVLRRGMRLSMRLPAGTEILKVAVYRVRRGKVVRKPVWLGYRVVGRLGRNGLYRVRLDSRALRRRLKAGLYQVNVTPGVSKRELGRTTTTRVRITRR